MHCLRPLCAAAGNMIFFRNALWYASGLLTEDDEVRIMPYCAHEHP